MREKISSVRLREAFDLYCASLDEGEEANFHQWLFDETEIWLTEIENRFGVRLRERPTESVPKPDTYDCSKLWAEVERLRAAAIVDRDGAVDSSGDRLAAAIELGIHSEHEAKLVLVALGYELDGEAAKRILGASCVANGAPAKLMGLT